MSLLLNMADNGLLPDRLIRFGIRQFDRKRLREENHGQSVEQGPDLGSFIAEMHQSPLLMLDFQPMDSDLYISSSFDPFSL